MTKYLLLILLLVLPLPANAGSDIQIARGVVCDSQAQVERLVSLVNTQADPQHALAIVNREADNPRACGSALVGFINAREIGTIRDHGKAFRVMELTIVAIPTATGSWSFIQPITQYAALPVEEIEV
jgi:hypothetical protein